MIFVLLAAGLFGIEYAIKNYIDKNKKIDIQEDIIKDKLVLRHMRNKGALLGTFEDKPKQVSAVMLTALGVLIASFFNAITNKKRTSIKVGFTFLLAGALSNVLEHVKKGYVVDYINLPNTKILKKIVFNLADVFVAIGAVIVCISEICGREKK